MMRCGRCVMLCLAAAASLWIVACQAIGSSAVPTAASAAATPTQTAIPVTPTPALTPTPTALAIQPTPGTCDSGFVLFSAKWNGDARDGIYLACSDGSYVQQVVTSISLVPGGWEIADIAIAPNGQTLAVEAINADTPVFAQKLYFLSSRDYSVIKVFAPDYRVISISWSPDSSYLAYLATDAAGDLKRIETLDIATLTPTTAITTTTPMTNLAWSPISNQILYSQYAAKPGSSISIRRSYLADIRCEKDSHRCHADDPRELSWLVDYWDLFSWVPNSAAVAVEYVSSNSNGAITGQYIDERRLNGQLIKSFNLNTISPDFLYDKVPPSVSFDGKRVALVGWVEQVGVPSVYIVNLDDHTFIDLSDKLPFKNLERVRVIWMP